MIPALVNAFWSQIVHVVITYSSQSPYRESTGVAPGDGGRDHFSHVPPMVSFPSLVVAVFLMGVSHTTPLRIFHQGQVGSLPAGLLVVAAEFTVKRHPASQKRVVTSSSYWLP